MGGAIQEDLMVSLSNHEVGLTVARMHDLVLRQAQDEVSEAASLPQARE
jgi:hypothetical protein